MTSIALVLALTAAVIFEGRTILVSISAWFGNGNRRLTRLGSVFLGSEAWVIALIGLSHRSFPDLMHEVFGGASLAAVSFVAGWMLRDLFLWVGPRMRRQGLARTLVGAGALAQLAGAGVVAATLTSTLAANPSLGSITPEGDLFSFVVLPVLIAGLCLQFAMILLPRAEYFGWGRAHTATTAVSA